MEGLSSSSTSINSLQIERHTQKRKAGRKKFQETRPPVFKGVRQLHNKSSRIWLGTFSSLEMAARAYEVAAIGLGGNSDSLNFPKTAHLLPKARSTSIKDIQYAALEAADQNIKDSSHYHYSSSTTSSSSLSSSSSSSKAGIEGMDKIEETCNGKMFLDEEELFNMPALLDSMAEGLILTPPAMKRGFSWTNMEDETVELSLWGD